MNYEPHVCKLDHHLMVMPVFQNAITKSSFNMLQHTLLKRTANHIVEYTKESNSGQT
jgi:hypothetical protein